MPCYNAAAWILTSVDSVLKQTHRELELLVVDDGSSDHSLEILKTISDPRLKVFTQQNRGAAAARNTALKSARGEWVQYLDADDLLAPDKIEQQLRAANNHGQATLMTSPWARFNHSIDEASFVEQPHWHDFEPVEFLLDSWLNDWMMHPACWLIRRDIIDAAGLWNEKLSLDDDGEYFSRIVLASKGTVFVPEAKSYYRSNVAGSLSSFRLCV